MITEATVPTYQYACTDCDHAFDQVQSFSEDSLVECPQCNGRLRKIFNAVGVVFKGSGFYRTDSRSEARTAEAGKSADSTGSTDTSTSTEGKSTEKSAETKSSDGASEKSSGAKAPEGTKNGSKPKPKAEAGVG